MSGQEAEDVSPPPVPLEELAEAIVQVAKGAKALLATRFREDTLVTLIHQAIKPASQRPTLDQIRTVLRTSADLERIYLKPKPTGVTS